MQDLKEIELSPPTRFAAVDWRTVPDAPGVYVILDHDEILYVGMGGRNGRGSVRNRLRDHGTGQIVNMFAQYLFLARVQFISADRIAHPRDAKAACRKYIGDRCSFQYKETPDAAAARELERMLKQRLRPLLNP